MSSTSFERLRFDDKPSFALGALVTYNEQPRVTVDGENNTVHHEVKDPDVGTVVDTVTVGPRKLTIDSGTAFVDEVMALDQMRLDAKPVPVRHWLFKSKWVVIEDLAYESEPGLGHDGTGEHLARTSFSITVTEVPAESVDRPQSLPWRDDGADGNDGGGGGEQNLPPGPGLNPGG